MEKFTTLTGVAAPMPTANIDTDQLIPKQFLKIVRRTGLGENLLYDQRYDDQGRPDPDFVLNTAPYDRAKILLAGDNFGCGSSREHAVWALMDFGVRCVISTSFSDIFSGNAVKNGLLAAVVSADNLAALQRALQASNSSEASIDLAAQTITVGDAGPVPFDIDPFAKGRLLEGLDEIAETLQHEADITAYEVARAEQDAAFIPTPLSD